MQLPDDFYFSQSNLQDYVDCPYRFYLRYYLRLKWPALVVDDALDFERRGQVGARFHRLIQQYLLGVPERRITDLADADPATEVSHWWEDFLQYTSPAIEGKKYVETTLSTSLDGYALLAKFDLIVIRSSGSLAIFDWKTSRRKPKKDWLLQRVQTRLYRFILAEAGAELVNKSKISPDQVSMHYWFAPRPEQPVTLPYSQDEYQSDRDFIKRLINEIAEREETRFLRTDDTDKCRYCVYRSHCDRGSQAGDLDAFEDFESGPEDFELDIEFEQIEEISF
ncbi:MAG: RecB family exonuclease [Brevefilum sp.]